MKTVVKISVILIALVILGVVSIGFVYATYTVQPATAKSVTITATQPVYTVTCPWWMPNNDVNGNECDVLVWAYGGTTSPDQWIKATRISGEPSNGVNSVYTIPKVGDHTVSIWLRVPHGQAMDDSAWSNKYDRKNNVSLTNGYSIDLSGYNWSDE